MAPDTYTIGSKRLDYILVDSMILPSIKKVGKMKLHKDIHLDHMMIYMDCDKDLTFKGKISSLVQMPARKFVIEKTDKVEGSLRGSEK